MFYKVNKDVATSPSSSDGSGRVYVLKLILDDGTVVHKVGMTHSDRSTDRMMEILRSWFVAYRYIPHTELRLDFKTKVPLLLERHLHQLLDELHFVAKYKTEGYTEMFVDVDEKELINYIRNFDYLPLLELPLDNEEWELVCSLLPEPEDIPF